MNIDETKGILMKNRYSDLVQFLDEFQIIPWFSHDNHLCNKTSFKFI